MRHDVGFVAAFGHSRPAPRLLHPRGRRIRRHLRRPQWRARLAATIPPTSSENRRRMAEQIGVLPEHFLSVHQVHSPDAVVATGPWQGPARPRADAIVTRAEGLAIGVTAADCGPVLLVDSDRARDRRGACRMEGRADRHSGIDSRGNGKARRRTQRHRRRDRPLDPPADLRSRRRIRRALHRGRRRQRHVLRSRRPRAVMRCSISPASSGCGWKMPAS